MPNENDIRDKLAERLELIEPGLELVSTNFHVTNSEGADGFIDILARDTTGVFVVIELKKAAGSSRQAMHEIGKYVDLLSRARAVPVARIRAVVISTTWHELLVPFSYYVHSSDFTLSGYELFLQADNLTPLRATEVIPLEPSADRPLTESQRRIVAESADALATAWATVSNELASRGVSDYVGRKLHLREELYAIVLCLGTMMAGGAEEPAKQELIASGDYDAESLEEYPVEECVLLAMEHSGFRLEVCYPSKVSALVNDFDWQDDGWVRAGVFENDLLFPSRDLVELVEGRSAGIGTKEFTGQARVRNQPQWRAFKHEINAVIENIDGWTLPLEAWMRELEALNPSQDIECQIFNQRDFLLSLVHGYGDSSLSRMMPSAVVVAKIPDGGAFGVMGALVWDGVVVDLRQALASVYESPAQWTTFRWAGDHDAKDDELLRALHLHYVWFEKRASEEAPQMLDVHDGRLRRISASRDFLGREVYGKMRPLGAFFDAFDTEIGRIVAAIRGDLMVDSANAVQMHMTDSRKPSPW
jgi:hypothetical protein